MIRAGALACLVLPASLWACAALWIDGPPSRALAGLCVAGFAGASVAAFWTLRPLAKAAAVWGLLFAAVLGWWLSLAPRADRDWQPDVARPPRGVVEGDSLVLHNVRNFHYRSSDDYDARWETRRYDLSALEGVDMYLVHWGSPWIAHTIVAWSFGEAAPPLAVSIETRKENGEQYSALLGFFRRFELFYVAADERDVIGLRAAHRGEQVSLYRLAMGPEVARAVLLDYVEEMNRLAERPEWYNALTHNCTTTIRMHARHVAAARPWDWRILVNGKLDELGYERGSIQNRIPFAELKRRSDVTARAAAAIGAPDFSRRIRVDLPARPARPDR